jgi:hypothetical protein
MSEPLPWAEICARYPDQYVCITDIEHPDNGSPVINAARVIGHGPTDDAAFEPVHALDARPRSLSVRFTGISTEPLIRPNLVIDDEDLEFLFA